MEPTVTRAMYPIENRRYIDIDNQRYKVPWRNQRVVAGICGSVTPIQGYSPGSKIMNLKYYVKDGVKVITSISINESQKGTDGST